MLATVGASPREALIVAGQPSVRAAAEGREGFSLIPRPEGMLQLVTVPIAIGLSNPDIQGTLSVGFLLDDALALQLKGITGSEIAFGMDGQVLATTLPAEDRAALAAVMRSRDSRGDVTLPTGDVQSRCRCRCPPMTQSMPARARSRSFCDRAPSNSRSCARSTQSWR